MMQKKSFRQALEEYEASRLPKTKIESKVPSLLDYFAAHCPLPWQDERTVGNNSCPYAKDARRRYAWAEAMLAEKQARTAVPGEAVVAEVVLEEM